MNLTRMFQEGGYVMYWLLLLGVPALILALTHLLLAKKWTLIASGISFCAVIGIAVYGMRSHQHKVDLLLGSESIDPRIVEKLTAEANTEAMRPIQLAGIMTGLGTLGLAVGEVRRRKRARA